MMTVELTQMGVVMSDAVRWVQLFENWREGNELDMVTLQRTIAEFAGVLQRVAHSLQQNMQNVNHLVAVSIAMQKMLMAHQEKLVQNDSQNASQEYRLTTLFSLIDNVNAHLLHNWEQGQEGLKAVQENATTAMNQTNQYVQQKIQAQDDKLINLENAIKLWADQLAHDQAEINQRRDTDIQHLWAAINLQGQDMASIQAEVRLNQDTGEAGLRERENLVNRGLEIIQRQNDHNRTQPFRSPHMEEPSRPAPILVRESPPPEPPHPDNESPDFTQDHTVAPPLVSFQNTPRYIPPTEMPSVLNPPIPLLPIFNRTEGVQIPYVPTYPGGGTPPRRVSRSMGQQSSVTPSLIL
jgi:aryl carrier-like protein